MYDWSKDKDNILNGGHFVIYINRIQTVIKTRIDFNIFMSFKIIGVVYLGLTRLIGLINVSMSGKMWKG